MTNIEKLKQLRILGSVRQRLGAENQDDESFDAEINEADNSKLIELWCGWHLGDGSWWTEMKIMFDELVEMDLNQKSPTELIIEQLLAHGVDLRYQVLRRLIVESSDLEINKMLEERSSLHDSGSNAHLN